MPKVISIGNQGFEDIRKENRFYVDKTEFYQGVDGNPETVSRLLCVHAGLVRR